VVTPTYQSLYSIPRGLGAEVSLVALDPDRGWALDLDRVASAVTARTRVIVLNVPNSPTGTLVSRETFASLVALTRERGIVLFGDEVYRWLEYDEAQRLPAGVEAYERGLSLGVMSKAFGLAGLRIGWIATRDADLLRRLTEFKHCTTICNSGPQRDPGPDGALRARAALLARARGSFGQTSTASTVTSSPIGAAPWSGRAGAGTIAFPALRGRDVDRCPAAELVEKRGVLILQPAVYTRWAGRGSALASNVA
jgi:aspartate/methionine/tyrosine aminotransferase